MLPTCLVRTPSEEKEWRNHVNNSKKPLLLPRSSSWVALCNNFFVLFCWWDSPFGTVSCTKSYISVLSLSGGTTKFHSGLSDDMPSELPWSPLSLQAIPAHHLSVPVVAVIGFALPLLFLHLCVVVCCCGCFPVPPPLLSWSLRGPLPSSLAHAVLCYSGWFYESWPAASVLLS